MSKKTKKALTKKQMSNKTKKASRKRQKKSSHSTKNLPIIIIVVAVVLIGGYFFYDKYSRVYPIDVKNITAANIDAIKGGESRPTLSPALFIGNVARTYKIAKENRELIDSLYCYCNCKKSIGHKSLLTCFVDRHAVNCSICKNQTLYAYSLYQKDNDIAQVRVAVDKRFWRPLR